MGTISLQIPQPGQPNNTEDPKISSDFTTVQTAINGNLDATNLTAAFNQSAGANVAGQTVKGVVVNAGPGTRTNVAYGALNDAADQSAGIVLNSNGLIAVTFQAAWACSVASVGNAAIFIGGNQVKVVDLAGTAPAVQAASSSSTANAVAPLFSTPGGLLSGSQSSSYTGDVTTGQVVGASFNAGASNEGGQCLIFAAAGTYTVSVQYKSSSGTVTASNRKLWVQAYSFA